MNLKGSLNPCHKKKMQIHLCIFDLDISCDRWKIREIELHFSFEFVVLDDISLIDIFQGCFSLSSLSIIIQCDSAIERSNTNYELIEI